MHLISHLLQVYLVHIQSRSTWEVISPITVMINGDGGTSLGTNSQGIVLGRQLSFIYYHALYITLLSNFQGSRALIDLTLTTLASIPLAISSIRYDYRSVARKAINEEDRSCIPIPARLGDSIPTFYNTYSVAYQRAYVNITMVYSGKPSTGCYLCRRRKIKVCAFRPLMSYELKAD